MVIEMFPGRTGPLRAATCVDITAANLGDVDPMVIIRACFDWYQRIQITEIRVSGENDGEFCHQGRFTA